MSGVILTAVLAAGAWFAVRAFGRGKPFPARFARLISNPLVDRVSGVGLLIRRADVGSGMRVLDAGCGAGRTTIPLARRVGESGEVVALDVQEAMLNVVRKRATELRLPQVTAVRAELGEGRSMPAPYVEYFDRALLVTVLGEIPDREGALRSLHGALKIDGILSVTEMILDPDYVRAAEVARLAEAAGFTVASRSGNSLMLTVNCRKRVSRGTTG